MKIIKRLGLSFLLTISISRAATDCVDCGNHIEGFPSISSLEQATCSDCKCYTETHAGTIDDLSKDRAAKTKEKLQASILKSNENLVQKISIFNKLQIGNTFIRGDDLSNTLKDCRLEKIKTNTSTCPSAKDSSHLSKVFGSDSIEGYISSIAKSFSGESQADSKSCLTKNDLNELQMYSDVLRNGKELLENLIRNKTAVLASLSDKTTVSNWNTGVDKELVKIKDAFIELSSLSITSPILNDPKAFKFFIENSSEFLNNPSKLIDYFKKDAYVRFPSVQSTALVEINSLCSELINNVSAMACAGDSLAYVDNPQLLANSFKYNSSDHLDGFDSMFADDSGLEFIESNYVTHLYKCSVDSCRDDKLNIPLCSKVKQSSTVNNVIKSIQLGEYISNTANKRLPDDIDASLCKLADCQGNQTQMNACYEGVKEELGEDADAILLSYSRVTNSSAQTSQQPGANYTPTQTPFAQQFLGSYSSTPVTATTPSQSSSAGPIPNDPSVGDFKSARTGISSNTNSSTGPRVVTANDAFQEFMNKRFDSLGSSASSFPRTQTNTVSPTTSARVGSNESMSPSERRALDSMNRASETIDELRESYRNSALDRMEKLVQQAASTSRNVTNTTPSVNTGVTSTGTNSKNQTNRNIRNPSAITTNNSNSVNIQNPPSNENVGSTNGNFPQEVSGARNVASTPNGSGASGRTIPRIQTNDQGLQTLNVNFAELPTINPAKVREEGVDTSKTFNIAVKVDQEVFLVEVRPTFVAGRRILEPMLDRLSSGLKAEVLKSPLFEEYRQYLLGHLVNN